MKKPGPALLLALLLSASLTLGQETVPRKPRSRQEPGAAGFKSLVAQAEAARDKDQVDEATRLYRRAVEIKPDYAEGWWYLGMLQYESDQYVDGAEAFSRVTRLKPEMALGWAMLGLCQFEIRKYESALVHLERSD